ncbi:hypothetical protein, partial [Treponema sp.]|uniref:hypothetical protein n=1 Tax=Treponema sp. TaxID=166 RepID=UPI00388D80E4
EGTKESASQSSVSVSEAPSQAASNSSGGIDELPDIGEMNLSSTSDDSMNSTNSTINSNDELISDSEFASGGGSFKETTTQDTDVMAKAIQTILAKDND